MAKVRVCFVCLGNICRSPTAEAVMRRFVDDAGLSGHFEVDSAGTGSWHVGEPPDSRSISAGKRRGFALSGRSRQFLPEDWDRFDYVLAMDRSNYDMLAEQVPEDQRGKLRLIRSFDSASPKGASVPDPYYSTDGFDEVIDLCEAACRGLLEHIQNTHALSS